MQLVLVLLYDIIRRSVILESMWFRYSHIEKAQLNAIWIRFFLSKKNGPKDRTWAINKLWFVIFVPFFISIPHKELCIKLPSIQILSFLIFYTINYYYIINEGIFWRQQKICLMLIQIVANE